MKMFRRVRRQIREELVKRGIYLQRVNYRVEVPYRPMPVQKVLLERLGVKRPIIFDIGANLGNVTARYRRMFPKAEIYSFEPLPELYEGLKRRFGEDEHIHLFPCAVSEQVGTADFHLTSFHTTNSLQPRKAQSRRYFPKIAQSTGERLTVETISLDAFCAEQGIEQVDILKFDIQGGEIRALRGATELLGQGCVKLIYTEAALIQHYEEEALLYEVTDFLADYEFSLYDLYHLHRGRNGQLRYCEAIFVSQQLRAGALDTFPEEP